MQFLKTLIWVIVAIVLVLFAKANWFAVTLNLWGEGDAKLVADVKLPLLVLVAFLVGFLPTFFIYRARLWALKRRLESVQPTMVGNMPRPPRPATSPAAAAAPAAAPASAAPADRSEEERTSTDSKIWPPA